MALQGAVSTNKYDGNVGLTCTWTATQDLIANKSILTWTLASDGSPYYTYVTGNVKLEINGEMVLDIFPRFDMQGGGYWSRTGTLEIPHNSDGSKTFTINVSAGIWYYTSSNCTGTGTFTLDQIPRASSATVPNFTMGTGGTVSITRAGAGFTHKLSVKLGSSTYEIASGVEKSYKWTPDLDEWGPRVPDASSAACTLILDTYSGNTRIGTAAYPFTLYVPTSAVPSVSSFAVSIVNDNPVVQGWGVAVKGYTKIRWEAAAEGAYGSVIRSYAFTAGRLTGSDASGTTGIIQTAGSLIPIIKVTDSRGRTTTDRESADAIGVYDYAAPNVADAVAYRCDENGNANEAGTHVRITLTANISSVGGRNSATLQYRYRLAGGSFGSWIDFTSGAILSGFDVENSYEFELRAVDALGMDKVASAIVPTESVWLNGRDGGKGAAFGKHAEEDDLLDVEWRTRLRGEVRMDKPYFTADNGETEWIFPPMEVGKEYRTMERHEAKSVYARRVAYTFAQDIGNASSTMDYDIEHGISANEFGGLVRCFSSDGFAYPFPYYTTSGGCISLKSVDENGIHLRAYKATMTARTLYFDVYYIKA